MRVDGSFLLCYTDTSGQRSEFTYACIQVSERPWDTPRHEHKSVAVASRYANVGRYVPVAHVQRRPKRSVERIVRVRSTEQFVGYQCYHM